MITFEQAETSKTHQRALLEVTCGDFVMGTLVYTSGKDDPHAGWRCVFPDNTFRIVDNDKIRLCW